MISQCLQVLSFLLEFHVGKSFPFYGNKENEICPPCPGPAGSHTGELPTGQACRLVFLRHGARGGWVVWVDGTRFRLSSV